MKTELTVALPFQSQFGWLLFGGRTKDLQCSVQNLLWNIFCDFSFILFLIFLCKSKEHFLYAMYTKN